MSGCIVFAGPTIGRAAIAEHLPAAVVAPPAQRGDIWWATEQGFDTVLLIDGYFERVPAVWHKEILYALSKGVRVYGSSSMGALRAAEMSDFGMVGVGAVVSMVRAGELDDDDVAVVHADHEHDFSQVSTANVDIIVTLRAACTCGVIDTSERDRLLARAKRTYYPERSYRRLLREARENRELSDERIDRLRAWLETGAVNQKQLDAMELLACVAGDPTPRNNPVEKPPAFVRTSHFERMVAEELTRDRRTPGNGTL